MNRVTKDTPVGTRVLVVWNDFKRSGGPFWARVAVNQGDRIECMRNDGSVFAASKSNVYLDEPAPGTWAWACERVATGSAVQRKLYDGVYKRMLIDGNYVVLQFLHDGKAVLDTLELDDLTATNWEIAP